jgi:hypothetical protein
VIAPLYVYHYNAHEKYRVRNCRETLICLFEEPGLLDAERMKY